MLLKKVGQCGFHMVALRKEFLRQHYLDQVLGSSAFRAKLSAFVVLPFKTAGWLPVDINQNMPIATERQGRQHEVKIKQTRRTRRNAGQTIEASNSSGGTAEP